jgi:HEPN domain-containing protein
MNERLPPDAPGAWLARARSDLALARVALAAPDVLLEDACYHTQQCAEKALKALLVFYQIDFPRTHVLEALLDLLKQAGTAVPPLVDEAVELTQYAVQARYPGVWEPVTRAEAEFAIRVSTWVLDWAEEQLAGE